MINLKHFSIFTRIIITCSILFIFSGCGKGEVDGVDFASEESSANLSQFSHTRNSPYVRNSPPTSRRSSTSTPIAVPAPIVTPTPVTPTPRPTVTPISQLPTTTPAPAMPSPTNSVSGCAGYLQTIGWNGNQDAKVTLSGLDYESYLVGQNERIDRHSGFSVSFRSSIYSQNFSFSTNAEMPSGFSVRIVNNATGSEIPISNTDFMGSSTYTSVEHPVLSIYSYKAPTHQGSWVQVSFRRAFFAREKMAQKDLKFELLCDGKVVASDSKNVQESPFASNMLDTYLRNATGAHTLTNRDGDVYNHILIDRSIDGGGLLMLCPVIGTIGQSINCNLRIELMSNTKWYVDNQLVPDFENKSSAVLSNLAAGRHSIRAKGLSVGGHAVESNIVFIDIK